MPQRPHFFVWQALQNGFSEVLWIEPTPSRLPGVRDLRSRTQSAREPREALDQQNIQVLAPRLWPVEPLPLVSPWINGPAISTVIRKVRLFTSVEPTLLVVGKPTRLALALAEQGDNWVTTTYDAMDNFPAFFKGKTRRSVEVIERKLVACVDHLVCSSSCLQAGFSRQSRLVANACSQKLAHELSGFPKANHPEPVLGYVGTLADWLDWSAVERLAHRFPQALIVMVGPQKVPAPQGMADNIHFRPAVGRGQITSVLRSFDFGIIPFKVNDLTSCVDPIKYYEYRAAGLPVLSTRFGEMANKGRADYVWDLEDVIDSGRLPFVSSETDPPGATTWEDRFDSGFFGWLSRGWHERFSRHDGQ